MVSADPTESITAQIGASGTAASTNSEVAMRIKPAGGSACGANPNADDGSVAYNSADVPNGPYSLSRNWTFDVAGSYLACAWLIDYTQSGAPVVASATQTVTVRQPHLSLAVAAPPVVDVGATFQVTTTAQAEAAREVYVGAVPDTGRGCPPNWGALQSTDGARTIVNGWDVTGGPFNDVRNASYSEVGSFLVCGYTLHQGGVVEAAASASLAVRPPCVVPKLAIGSTLDAANAALAAAGCTAGRITARPSRKVARGLVLRAAQKIGMTLTPLAPVGVVVSDGPPCVVPSVLRGSTIFAVTRRLTAAGCTLGKIRRRADRRVRAGRVLAVIPRAGTTLAPRAAVVVLVSRGRR